MFSKDSETEDMDLAFHAVLWMNERYYCICDDEIQKMQDVEHALRRTLGLEKKGETATDYRKWTTHCEIKPDKNIHSCLHGGHLDFLHSRGMRLVPDLDRKKSFFDDIDGFDLCVHSPGTEDDGKKLAWIAGPFSVLVHVSAEDVHKLVLQAMEDINACARQRT